MLAQSNGLQLRQAQLTFIRSRKIVYVMSLFSVLLYKYLHNFFLLRVGKNNPIIFYKYQFV